jgi:hypothetical protein
MREFGTKIETFANIRAKASRHVERNPLTIFPKAVTEEEVMQAPALSPGAMTRLMTVPPTCSAAAALIVSKGFAKKLGIDMSFRIRAQAMTTAVPSACDDRDMRELGVSAWRATPQTRSTKRGESTPRILSAYSFTTASRK